MHINAIKNIPLNIIQDLYESTPRRIAAEDVLFIKKTL